MSLYLSDIGWSSPFGPGLETTLSALKTGERRLAKSESFVGSDFKPQVCCFQPSANLQGFEPRVIHLVEEAVDDLLAQHDQHVSLNVDVILCLAEASDLDGLPKAHLEKLGFSLADRVARQLSGSALQISSTRFVAAGQAGPARVLESIYKKGITDRAFLLICADSLADRRRLTALIDQQRLFSDGSPYGLVPGEAAGALLLLPQAMLHKEEMMSVLSAGSCLEEIGELEMRDSLFSGLSDSALKALDALQLNKGDVSQIYSDFNNGRYRAGETSYCQHRLMSDYLTPEAQMTYTSMTFGDVGSASLAAAIVKCLLQTYESENAITSIALASTTHNLLRGSVVFQSNPIRAGVRSTQQR